MTYFTLNELAKLTLEDIEKTKLDLALVVADAGLPDCPIIYCSDAFMDHSGYDRSEIIGRNCRFMQGEETETRSIDAFRTALLNRVPLEVQITNYRKDGTKFKNHVLMQPIKGSAEAQRLFVAVQKVIPQ